MLAIIRIAHDARTAVYLAKQRANGETKREAIRSLKRHLARRVYHLLHDPNQVPTTICLTYETHESPGGSPPDPRPSGTAARARPALIAAAGIS